MIDAPCSNRAAAHPGLLSVVACFYNEAAGIDVFFQRLIPILAAVEELDFEIICVNDGSTDATLRHLIGHAKLDQRIKVIDLSRNFGKEAALTAGLDHARGDAVIPMDADLQDPPEIIPQMIALWRRGSEVVLARRVDRRTDHAAKRVTARLFYRLHNLIGDISVPRDVGDFRLMDRQVVLALRQLPENRRYMKGLFAWLGFHTAVIDFTREARQAGKSRLSWWNLWRLAVEGITSFSTIPLRIWTYIGLCISLLAFLYIVLVVILVALDQMPFPGYATIVVAIMSLGGIQLIGIGVLGEYIGRIYAEAKRRPIYLIRAMQNFDMTEAAGRQSLDRPSRCDDENGSTRLS